MYTIIADMKITSHIKTKRSGILLIFMLECIFLQTSFKMYAQVDNVKQPVYFHISHHQEDVGRVEFNFPKFGRFKQNIKTELQLLDQYNAKSDQCFSDFIVSVILYMDSTSDPGADSIFTWFNNSQQNLGYHFHPTTWDINIRTDKIKDMDLGEAITAYEKWEKAYYDWSDCDTLLDNITSTFCGNLDTNRLGGIQLMQQYFKKPVVNECLSILNPAAGQVLRNKYGSIVPIVGQAGNPHSYYTTSQYEKLWMSDWMFSTEPGIYVYKLMGNFYIQNRSGAWVEGLMDIGTLEQVLSVLPRNIPHMFAIHLTIPPIGDQTLKSYLEYLTTEFFPDNPHSQFISTGDIPDLIELNSCEFSMEDLVAASTYVLSEWHGRPPAFVKYTDHFTSLAALFKALQTVLAEWHTTGVWPATVKVPEFIWPPLGRNELIPPFDSRLADGFPYSQMLQAINSIQKNDSIPYIVEIPDLSSSPMHANAAEFLSGMCSLFIRLQQGYYSGKLYIWPSSIMPISNLPVETAQSDSSDHVTPTNMDWLSGLQLWTIEPIRLRSVVELSSKDPNKNSAVPDFILNQNYPNPFSESTTIVFFVPEQMHTCLNIYDLTGNKICTLADKKFDRGWHSVVWRNSDLDDLCSSRVFIYQLATEKGTLQKKAVMIKE